MKNRHRNKHKNFQFFKLVFFPLVIPFIAIRFLLFRIVTIFIPIDWAFGIISHIVTIPISLFWAKLTEGQRYDYDRAWDRGLFWGKHAFHAGFDAFTLLMMAAAIGEFILKIDIFLYLDFELPPPFDFFLGWAIMFALGFVPFKLRCRLDDGTEA